MAVVAENTGLTLRSFRGSTSRRRKERIVHGLFAGAAGLSVLISVADRPGAPGTGVLVPQQVSSSLWSHRIVPREGEFDIPTLFIGTIEVALIAMVIAHRWDSGRRCICPSTRAGPAGA